MIVKTFWVGLIMGVLLASGLPHGSAKAGRLAPGGASGRVAPAAASGGGMGRVAPGGPSGGPPVAPSLITRRPYE